MQAPRVPTSAILFIMGSTLCFSLLDSIVKYLAPQYPVALLVWARWSFQALATALWLAPRVTLFYRSLVCAVIMRPLLPALDIPLPMPFFHIVLICTGGLLGTLGHFLFILAFQRAPASALTPFTYMQLVWATLIGWAVFAE